MKTRSIPETAELPDLDPRFPEPEPAAAPRSGALVKVADARSLRDRSQAGDLLPDPRDPIRRTLPARVRRRSHVGLLSVSAGQILASGVAAIAPGRRLISVAAYVTDSGSLPSFDDTSLQKWLQKWELESRFPRRS
jgi:hypothetical protein